MVYYVVRVKRDFAAPITFFCVLCKRRNSCFYMNTLSKRPHRKACVFQEPAALRHLKNNKISDYLTMILSVNNLLKSYDGNDILKDISFHIEANDKLGITGANGAGKTTLIKQIIGEEIPDSGSITLAKGVRPGYLSQMTSEGSDRSIYDEVISVKQELLDIERELRTLEQHMHALFSNTDTSVKDAAS